MQTNTKNFAISLNLSVLRVTHLRAATGDSTQLVVSWLCSLRFWLDTECKYLM